MQAGQAATKHESAVLAGLAERVFALHAGALVLGLLTMTAACGVLAVTAAVVVAGLTGRLLVAMRAGSRAFHVAWLIYGLGLILLVTLTTSTTDSHHRLLVDWAICAVAMSMAISRGPLRGAAAWALLASSYLAIHRITEIAVTPAVLVDTVTSVAVGCVVHVGTVTGFALRRRSVLAAQAAEADRREAKRRLVAQRALDRELHDTLLSTLSLIAVGAAGGYSPRLHEFCTRDLASLRADSWGPPPDRDIADSRVTRTATAAVLRQAVEAMCAEAERNGLRVRPYVDLTDGAPGESTLLAWRGAVDQCLANVKIHSGCDVADLIVNFNGVELLTVVIDEGRGFDPAGVRPGRLGLVGSVSERIEDVGGTAKVWSRPGQGTAVELRLPVRVAP